MICSSFASCSGRPWSEVELRWQLCRPALRTYLFGAPPLDRKAHFGGSRPEVYVARPLLLPSKEMQYSHWQALEAVLQRAADAGCCGCKQVELVELWTLLGAGGGQSCPGKPLKLTSLMLMSLFFPAATAAAAEAVGAAAAAPLLQVGACRLARALPQIYLWVQCLRCKHQQCFGHAPQVDSRRRVLALRLCEDAWGAAL